MGIERRNGKDVLVLYSCECAACGWKVEGLDKEELTKAHTKHIKKCKVIKFWKWCKDKHLTRKEIDVILEHFEDEIKEEEKKEKKK